MQLTIIHLEHRKDRLNNLHKQIEEQGIDYCIMDGIVDKQMPFRGICRAHKFIVRLAREQRMSMVAIGEDDLQFSDKGAWDYFLEHIPNDFDLYLGSVYEGEINGYNRVTSSFCGLTLYIVHERFYQKFLSLRETNHLDRELGELSKLYKFYVCSPFVVKQIDGWSDNKKRYCEYDKLMEGKPFFKRNVV